MEIQSIEVAQLTRGRFPVRVVAVNSPGSFWVQPQPNRENFCEFLEELDWKMERRKNRFPCWPHHLRPGAIVAIKRRGHWERGLVTTIKGGKVQMELKDWGKEITVPVGQVQQLPKELHAMNWGAFHCSLADARPAGGHMTWSAESGFVMEDLMKGKEIWIRIQRTTADNMAEVRAIVDTDRGAKDLRELLINHGCAA